MAGHQSRPPGGSTNAAVELDEGAIVFSTSPDGSTWLKPDTVTQQHTRMCNRLGWAMHLHQLRHYSATELIASGVDIRTVAGRLGHGGGTTTLRVYSASVAEADQRAAKALAGLVPELPRSSADPTGLPALFDAPILSDDASPYRTIARDLRAAIRCGALLPGEQLPTINDLARVTASQWVQLTWPSRY